LKILENIEVPEKKWKKLLDVSSFASFFQTPDFFRLINTVPGLSAMVFAVEESDIKALCVVTLQKEPGIKGFFSRRAIIYGGPVLYEANEANIDLLIKSVERRLKRKAIYIEIRNLNDYNAFNKIFLDNNWEYLSYQNFRVNCSAKEDPFDRFGNNRKRQIKKAIESGVLIREVTNLEEVNIFYGILSSLYKHKIGKPLLPRQFFEEFFRNNIGKYLLVVYNEKIIGGIMCPILEGRSIYELFICGLDEDYKEQSPSVMATWAAIDYANKNQIPVFDFMGAGRKDQDYGVREFKSRFGGELVEYGRYIKINNGVLYKIGEQAIKFIKRSKK
jgi:serine/alanine adding enzyme